MKDIITGYSISRRFKYNKDNTICTLRYTSKDGTIHLQICGIAHVRDGDVFDIHEGEYYAQAKAMRKLAKKLCEILSYLYENKATPKFQLYFWEHIYLKNDILLKERKYWNT